MSKRAIRLPSPAMVVALVALFVALAGSGYAAAKLNGKKIKNRTVTGKKLKRNTVGGTEINESRLVLPDQAAVGRSGAGQCNPGPGGAFSSCAVISLPLPHSGRVLVVATTDWFTVGGGGSQGACAIQVDGAQLANTTVNPGEAGVDQTTNLAASNTSTTGVTGPLAAGTHTLSLNCSEVGGSIEYLNSRISAVVLGSS